MTITIVIRALKLLLTYNYFKLKIEQYIDTGIKWIIGDNEILAIFPVITLNNITLTIWC